MPVPPNRKGKRRRPRQGIPAEPVPTPPLLAVTLDAVYRPEAIRLALGMQRSTIRREIRLGRLVVARVSGRYYVTGHEVMAWLVRARHTPAAREQPPPPAAGAA